MRPFAFSAAVMVAAALLSSCGEQKKRGATASAAKPSPALVVPKFAPFAIGSPASEFGHPLVTNVHLADLDRDGLIDVLYCEAQHNTVRWIRQSPRGVFTDRVIAEGIKG